MSYLRHTVLSIALAAASIGSWAQPDTQQAQHHPDAPAVQQSSANNGAAATRPGKDAQMATMDSKMKAMAEMHEKMMNAKTPEEKKALMAEHMKTMQDGMATMGMMGGTGMAGMQGKKPMPRNMKERQQMMEKRMEMMESMMQMMMDRMPAPAAN